MNPIPIRFSVIGIALTVFATMLAALALALAPPAAVAQDGWTSLLAPQLQKYHQPEVNALHFFNRHIGWAVGGHARDRAGKNGETLVLRTSDGGTSWERLPLYDGQKHVPDFVGIGFADANHGWLLSDRDLVLRTTDGGEIWEPVEPLPRGWGKTLLVLGPDAVMVGSTSTNGRQINVTTDGGRSWRNSTVIDDGRANVVDLAFVPGGSFFAVVAGGMQDQGGIYRSDDGGRSWSAVAEGKEPLHTIAFSKSGRNGVAAGDKAAYTTTDGGSAWQRVPVAGMRYAAQFLDEENVIAFGRDPAMLISGDGGRSWRPETGPDLGYSWHADVQMVDPGWWLVAGGKGGHDLFLHEDPAYSEAIARGTLTLPDAVRNVEGTPLPPGLYDFTLTHTSLDHGFLLSLRNPAENVETGVDGELATDQYACEPCEGYFPVDVEYEKEEVDGSTHFKLSLDPTPTGATLVLDAAATPPRDLSSALAALGIAEDTQLDATEAADSGQSGGVLGRLKKAASGDVRGAVEGAVDPAAASSRVQEAKASPISLYRIRLSYPIDIVGKTP